MPRDGTCKHGEDLVGEDACPECAEEESILSSGPTEHEQFEDIVREMIALHLRKAHDYGDSSIDEFYDNLDAAKELGIPAWKGIVLRMNDKMARLKKFCRAGELKNESVEDSFIDIAVYAIKGLIKYRRDNPSKPQ